MTPKEAGNVAWDARVNWETRPTPAGQMREALLALDVEVMRLQDELAAAQSQLAMKCQALDSREQELAATDKLLIKQVNERATR